MYSTKKINALAAIVFASASLQVTAQNVREYYFAPLDYYFLTGRQSDFVVLDAAAGWSRTGSEFITPTLSAGSTESVGVKRFYFDKIARNQQRGSHFYTLKADDVAALRALNPSNLVVAGKPVDEGDGFRAFAPLADGSCQKGALPVYRLFRGTARFPDDPNHRFVSTTSLYNDFVAKGWTGEGVAFCVYAASSFALTPLGGGKQSIARIDYVLTYTREEKQLNDTLFNALCSLTVTATNNNAAPVLFAAIFDWSKNGIVQINGQAITGGLQSGETKAFAGLEYGTDIYGIGEKPTPCDRSYTLNPYVSYCYLNPQSSNPIPCTP